MMANSTSTKPKPKMTINNNKQLTMFMTLTKSLLSNDATKRTKRMNLAQKITSTIMNNPKFSSYLQMAPNLTIQQQLNSIHCKICQRDIELLQHRDHEIHIFSKSLFYKLTDNNDTLTNIILVLIFNTYSNMMPKSLILLTNNQNKHEIDQEMDILGKLRAITVIIDRLYDLFKRKNSLKTEYSQNMMILETQFNFLMFSLCSIPKHIQQTQSTDINTKTLSTFNIEPYKLPSLQVQTVLIEFWSKYPLLLPNDPYFRTLYLLRWLCRIPSDFESNSKLYNNGRNIINSLLNIMTINFNNIDLNSSSSETVLMLFTILAFLGGSSISICDTINKTKLSVMLYRMMERIPLTLKDNLKNNIKEIISNVGVKKLGLIISKMFEWPQNDTIYQWILELLQNLEKKGYFNLLGNIVILHSNKIGVQLKQMNEANNLNGALIILQYLLYGFRRSAQGFHNILPSLIEAIKTLKLLINDGFFYGKLQEIIELSHIMLFIWPGYPSLYYPLSEILHDLKHNNINNNNNVIFPEPNDQRIRYILKKYEWKAKRPVINTKDEEKYNYNKPSISGHDDQFYGTNDWITGNSKYSSGFLSAESSVFVPAKRNKITNKAGLTNLGATCYMNSIVQALYLSDDFRIKLLAMKLLNYGDDDNKMLNKNKWMKMKEITEELQNIFGHLKFTKREAVSTRKFVNLLPSPWTAGRQQDASEFAKYLLDCIWETIQHSTDLIKYNMDYFINLKEKEQENNDKKYDIKHNKIDPFFGGLQRNNIKCSKCNNISSKFESFTEIALSMTQNNDGNNDNDDDNNKNKELCTTKMIDEHFGIEILKGDNKYFCSKCNEKVEAERYTEIVNPPKHLIICFKRFSWNYQTMKRIKKNDWVNCPLTLDLPINDKYDNNNNNDDDDNESDMDIDDGDNDDNVDNDNKSKCDSVKYLLYSAVIHSGRSAEFGHYYTIGRHVKKALKSYDSNNNNNNNIDNDVWYMFNDRSVSMSTYDKLCRVSHYYKTDVPYLLFYKRIDNKKDDDEIDKEKLIIIDNNNDNEKKEEEKEEDDDMDIVDESEWEKKVEEDNKTFEKELAQFSSQNSTLD